jgi:hypothetical protein
MRDAQGLADAAFGWTSGAVVGCGAA